MSDVWVIKKRGLWYRPDARGYTKHLSSAGLFSPIQANGHLEAAAGVTIHRLIDLQSEIEYERKTVENDYAARIALIENCERAALGLTYSQPQ